MAFVTLHIKAVEGLLNTSNSMPTKQDICSTLLFSSQFFFLKALIIRLFTTTPLMPDFFKIFSIISVMADSPRAGFFFLL